MGPHKEVSVDENAEVDGTIVSDRSWMHTVVVDAADEQ